MIIEYLISIDYEIRWCSCYKKLMEKNGRKAYLTNWQLKKMLVDIFNLIDYI